jgi:hypothetical protein
MSLVTIYALFGDDVRILATNIDGDVYFWILNLIALSLFGIEILLSCIAIVNKYKLIK